MPSGDTRANGITVPLHGGDELSLVFKSSSGARTHLILDLTGYFASPWTSTRANGVTAPVGGGDDLGLVYKSSSGARTHLILDLTGYFAPS